MPKIVAVDFQNQPERPKRTEGNLNGPGSYEPYDNFGEHTNKLTIGVKRDEHIPVTPGPGTYNPEQADSKVMARAPATDFSKQTARLDTSEGN